MKPSETVMSIHRRAAGKFKGCRISRKSASDRAVAVARHEAGHFAAGVFLWDVPLSASIIPDAGRAGHITVHYDDAAGMIEHNPELELRGRGYGALIKLLAGQCAEQEWSDLDEDNPDRQNEASDLFKAARIADVMARRGYPARRVLEKAERWTREMLAMPDVCGCVERVAGLLLEHGTVEDPAALVDSEFGSVLGLHIKLTKWRKRLMTA